MQPDRIQGTDGVRGKISLEASERPIDDFVEYATISPGFTEKYAFAWATMLLGESQVEKGDAVVLGWDPRDPEEVFVKAAIKGLRKAGLRVLGTGILPTPAIPMFMQLKNAVGSMMLTASHNPSDQQGIKLFQGYTGLKFLPDDDQKLTSILFDQQTINLDGVPEGGVYEDCTQEASAMFVSFHQDELNSWVSNGELNNSIIFFDASKGALTPVLEEIGKCFPVDEVHYSNMSIKGDVNEYCGVADLEGREWIFLDEIIPENAFFHPYETLLNMAVRASKEDVTSGEKWLCAYVFDGDGDRCFRLDYILEQKAFLVSSGDALGFHQAAWLKKNGKTKENAWFMHTVESDLLTSLEAGKAGWNTKVTAVGDKWILSEAVKLTWQQTNEANGLFSSPLASFEDSFKLSGKQKKLPKKLQDLDFQIGFEESGHSITPGYLELHDGSFIPVFSGNGIKTALNSFVAIESMFSDADTKKKALEEPFAGGLSSTSYVYNVDKSLLKPGSVFRELLIDWVSETIDELSEGELSQEFIEYSEEETMLYWNILDGEEIAGSIFVRNSGTEDKSALYSRGYKEFQCFFDEVIQQFHLVLLAGLKRIDSSLNQLSIRLMNNLKNGNEVLSGIADKEKDNANNLLRIMEAKEKLLERIDNKLKLSIVGQGFIESWEAKIESRG